MSQKILAYITQKVKDARWCARIASTKVAVLQGDLEAVTAAADYTLEDVMGIPMGKEVVRVATAQVEKAESRKLDARYTRDERKLTNRALYLPKLTMHYSARPDGTVRYGFDQDLDAAGLMARWLEYKGITAVEPVVLNMENRLPKFEDENGKLVQYRLHDEEVENLWEHGLLFSAGKTAWNIGDNPVGNAVRPLFSKMFPQAIDFASYNRRFRAPLIPRGFLANIRVRTSTSMGLAHASSYYDEEGEETKLYTEVPMGFDGAGWYDPDHQDVRELMETYGKVPLQFTAFHPCGKVWKGMVYPREGLNSGVIPNKTSAFWFDHLQVKGAFKSAHKKLDAMAKTFHSHVGDNSSVVVDAPIMSDGCFIGIIKAKTHMGSVGSCFELVENMGPGGPFLNAEDYVSKRTEAKNLLKLKVTEQMEEIGELGPEGLLGRASRENTDVAAMVDFIVAANSQGAEINPLDVPMLQAILEDSLGKTLWRPANGGGLEAKYPVYAIDDTLAPGTCVVPGFKAGTEIASFRLPTILAAGLNVLTVVEASPHHIIDRRLISGTIWLNTQDSVVKQQADDDGDEGGVTDCPATVRLFELRKDNRVFHIEPEGEKLPHSTFSPEGRKYIGRDPTGPVGAITIMKAQLAAVGADGMELAFAVGAQEAIDSNKRHVRATDPYKAADLKNWYCHPDTGEYYIHYKIDGEYVTDNFLHEEAGGFPLELYEAACSQTLIDYGCVKKDKKGKVRAGWALGWRTQYKVVVNGEGKKQYFKLNKSISFRNWEESRRKQDTSDTNWVHYCHDLSRDLWSNFEHQWKSGETLVARDVLPKILSNLGIPMIPNRLTWDQYVRGLRRTSGLENYGKKMHQLLGQRFDAAGNEQTQQGRLAQIDLIKAELNVRLSSCTAQDLLDIWYMELTPTWWYWDNANKTRVYVTDPALAQKRGLTEANKSNYAFHAVSSNHSAIMELLGFNTPSTCSYLVDRKPQLASNIVDWCMRGNPYKRFTMMVRGDSGHSAAKTDTNGEPKHLGDCIDCMEVLRTSLVRRVRDAKSAEEIKGTGRLISAMNRSEQVSLPNWIYEPKVETDGFDTQHLAM